MLRFNVFSGALAIGRSYVSELGLLSHFSILCHMIKQLKLIWGTLDSIEYLEIGLLTIGNQELDGREYLAVQI